MYVINPPHLPVTPKGGSVNRLTGGFPLPDNQGGDSGVGQIITN